MKVKEAIEILSQFDPEATVSIRREEVSGTYYEEPVIFDEELIDVRSVFPSSIWTWTTPTKGLVFPPTNKCIEVVSEPYKRIVIAS